MSASGGLFFLCFFLGFSLEWDIFSDAGLTTSTGLSSVVRSIEGLVNDGDFEELSDDCPSVLQPLFNDNSFAKYGNKLLDGDLDSSLTEDTRSAKSICFGDSSEDGYDGLGLNDTESNDSHVSGLESV